MTDDSDDLFNDEIDPFAEDLDLMTQPNQDGQRINAGDVSLESHIPESTEEDDLNVLMNASERPAPTLTAEAVSVADNSIEPPQDVNPPKGSPTPAKNHPPKELTLNEALLQFNEQTLADELAVLLEVPLVADRESVPFSNPKEWRYNYRIAHESVSIRLLQVEFQESKTIFRIPFTRKHLYSVPGNALRLNLLHVILQHLKIGTLGYYQGHLALIPNEPHGLVLITDTILECVVTHQGMQFMVKGLH